MNQYRLGVPVKIVGAPGLYSHDSRRWQNHPHLSVSLAYLRDIFEYLNERNIRFYRMSGQLAPYLTHPQLRHFHDQLTKCSTELASIGDSARLYRLRLSLHPAHYIHTAWESRPGTGCTLSKRTGGWHNFVRGNGISK